MIRTLTSFSAGLALACALAVSLTGPAPAQSVAGAYLAGQHAAARRDFDAAAQYYSQALARDPSNAEMIENAIIAQLALGRVDRAKPLATMLEARDLRSQAAHMVSIAVLLQAEDYEGYLARDRETMGIGPLVDGLLEAWAQVGAGDASAGMASFDTIAQEPGLQGFAMYHKAMALAGLGQFEEAEAIFAAQNDGPLQRTRRGAMARAEVLSQLGRNDEAVASIRRAFGSASDPELTAMADALAAGETVPYTYITSPRDGAAEVFFSVAGALRQDAGAEYTLLYARLARYLRPDHVDALLLSAELLESLDQHELANAAYKEVPADHPAFHAAELGRAAALRQSGKLDAAVEVLEQLAKRFGELPVVHSTLGDVLRQQDRFEAATAAYDRALELSDETSQGQWFLHYARAISLERLDEWPRAEADFRRALELNPGQPQVLNYLGYSLVEKQIKLDEALALIEEAVAASPDSGYIVDSLGWVLYRLGRYGEAVGHMERAVELMPVDPVVNDHLGDVYWAVGREREARFQWMRALSFVDPEDVDGEADPERMRRKLEVGLDQVLEEEGSAPLKVTDDEG
ncbi:tetratricopeptide repeat protein [uncultured Tateyamaria sp.]|uniref:tetratricopeptide repeat protein n=1 Tax=uncultured Tateyamaria sp. TaxID=455651 RepID=UPI00262DBAA1|nr:tetratricopeptide repeat protein [uncultured Tateyamaria sp.]